MSLLGYKGMKMKVKKCTILCFLHNHLNFVNKDSAVPHWSFLFLYWRKWRSLRFLLRERSLLSPGLNWLALCLRMKKQSFWVWERVRVKRFWSQWVYQFWIHCLCSWLRWEKTMLRIFTTVDWNIRDRESRRWYTTLRTR